MMSVGMKKFYIYLLIFFVIIIFLLVPLIVPYLSRSADFSVFNDDWNGTSDFYRAYLENADTIDLEIGEERFLNTTFGDISDLPIDDPLNTLIVCIGPGKSYSEAERIFMKEFVSEGGTLFLSNDFGTGNDLLEGMGLESRFSNSLMMDIVFQTSGLFPIVYKGSDLSEYNLLLNYPSTLNAENSLFSSTEMAFLDLDEDYSYDVGEPKGPFDILAVEHLGEGSVYMLSDPSLLINNIFEKMDNKEYVMELMGDITNNFHKTVYIDEAHLGSLDDVERLNLVVTMPNNSIFRYLMIAFLSAIIVIEGRLLSHLNRAIIILINKFKFGKETTLKRTDKRELIASLKGRHPEWHASSLNSFFSKFR